MKFGGKEGDQT